GAASFFLRGYPTLNATSPIELRSLAPRPSDAPVPASIAESACPRRDPASVESAPSTHAAPDRTAPNGWASSTLYHPTPQTHGPRLPAPCGCLPTARGRRRSRASSDRMVHRSRRSRQTPPTNPSPLQSKPCACCPSIQRQTTASRTGYPSACLRSVEPVRL